MSRTIKVGVVGVGSLGQHHARIYSRLNAADLAGIYDTNRPRAARAARKYRTRFFDSLNALGEGVEER